MTLRVYTARVAYDGSRRVPDSPVARKFWSLDCAKRSRQLTEFCLRTVDFKVQPRVYFADARRAAARAA